MLKPMVKVRNEGGTLVADFWDCLRLDPAPVRDLRQHFETHIRRGDPANLVVDLNGVTYAGSTSLGGFIVLHRISSQHGGRIVFCNVDDNVLEVFRVSKLTPLFAFAQDCPAALGLLSQPPAPPITPAIKTNLAPRPDGPLRRNRPRDTD